MSTHVEQTEVFTELPTENVSQLFNITHVDSFKGILEQNNALITRSLKLKFYGFSKILISPLI